MANNESTLSFSITNETRGISEIMSLENDQNENNENEQRREEDNGMSEHAYYNQYNREQQYPMQQLHAYYPTTLHHHQDRIGYHHANHGFIRHSTNDQMRQQYQPRARVGDWMCPNQCGLVFSSKSNCFRCGIAKPFGSEIQASALPPQQMNQYGAAGDQSSIYAASNRQYQQNGMGRQYVAANTTFNNGSSYSMNNLYQQQMHNQQQATHSHNVPRVGDWLCPNGCGNVYSSKQSCFRCGMMKPEQAKILSDADVPSDGHHHHHHHHHHRNGGTGGGNNGFGSGRQHGFGFFNGNSQEFPTIATATQLEEEKNKGTQNISNTNSTNSIATAGDESNEHEGE